MFQRLYLYLTRMISMIFFFFGLFQTGYSGSSQNITVVMMKQKQEKQIGYCACGITLRLMLNLTRIRASFLIFNYKVKTKLLSRHRLEREAAFSCAAV